MMNKLLLPLMTATALTATSGFALAQQNSDVSSSTERSTQFIESYDFTHVLEAEWKDHNRLDVEGFLENGWFVEVRFDSDGNVIREERENLITGSWGLTTAQFTQVLERGVEAGMVRFDELDIDKRGEIELEGYNQNDQDIEIKLMLSDLN